MTQKLRHPVSRPADRVLLAAALAALASVLPGLALAHGGEGLTDANALTTWRLTPEVSGATVLVALAYFQGIARRSTVQIPVPRWRHVSFLSGLGLVFLALQSPIDPMAERLFWMHQVQHLLLRMLGPMLIALGAPQGLLTAGLPRGMRRTLLAPAASGNAVRAGLRLLRQPAVAFGLFVASLYFWQIPPIHNAAVLDPVIHYAMHVTMLAAGLLFWFLIFDPRDPPKGVRYGVRVVMLIGTILSNILIGSLTTLKEVVLYTAYDVQERLFNVAPLTDEITGGYTIWVPGSMMCVIAIVITVHRWSGHEEKTYTRRFDWSASNSRALEHPQTAQELRMKVRAPNRAVGLGIATLSLSVLVTVLTVAVIITTLA